MSDLQNLNTFKEKGDQFISDLTERNYTPTELKGLENAREKIQASCFDKDGNLRSDLSRINYLETLLTQACVDLELYREKISKLQRR